MKIKNPFLSILFAFAILYILAYQFLVVEDYGPFHVKPTPIPTPSGSHPVVYSNLNLVEVWRYRTGFAASAWEQLSPPAAMIVAQNKVVIGTSVDVNDPANRDSFLTALALDSGQMLWQTRYSEVDFGTVIYSSYLDSKLNRLYLQYGFNLSAFDPETGKQLWATPNLGEHTTYIFAHEQQDGVLTVRTNNNELLTFDPNDGRLLSRQKVAYFLTITHAGIEIPIPQTPFDFQWAFECARPKLWPTFVDDEDLLLECAWRDSAWPYILYRANYKTGQTVWRTPRQFISGYAIRGNTLYLLDEFTQLDAIDMETGAFLGSTIFDNKLTKDAMSTRPFWVAIQDPYLVIYFGDTQELVAFRFGAQ
jgi:outer membrane protein assembly factor BamB